MTGFKYGWDEKDELVLLNAVLNEIRSDGTIRNGLVKAATTLGKSVEACQMRWQLRVKIQHAEQIATVQVDKLKRRERPAPERCAREPRVMFGATVPISVMDWLNERSRTSRIPKTRIIEQLIKTHPEYQETK